MARRRTARQRAASRRNIRKAQLVSARLRKGTGKVKRKSKGLSRRQKITAVAALTVATGATGVYAVDRARNMKVYHNTSHHRARTIVKNGYAPGKEGRRPNLHISDGTGKAGSHEAGRVFFAAGRNNARFFGPAATSMKVRKKAFYKVANLDNHPAALAGGYKNFYFVEARNVGALGKPTYGRRARASANYRIRRKGQGMT